MKRFMSIILSITFFFTMSIPVDCHAEEIPTFSSVSDPELLEYIENTTYTTLVTDLNNSGYLVEDVRAVYISQEYIDELNYNSLPNLFFGYTLDEVVDAFEGTRYVFTLGTGGETVVKEFEPYDDSIDYGTIIKNVAIGSGVILLCITVTAVSAGAGAPAICMIFAYAADGAILCAKSGAFFGAIASGITTYSEHGDFDAALRSAAVGASEGYKWGAITGAATGAAKETIWLSRAIRNGLTMNEAALIQAINPKLPLSVIRSLHSFEEYEVYESAGLTIQNLGESGYGLTRSIDWTRVDEYGRTNAQRVRDFMLSPIDENGVSYELHHIGQEPTSPLAILTKAEHMSDGHNKILHWRLDSSVEHGSDWATQKHEFWMSLLNAAEGGV